MEKLRRLFAFLIIAVMAVIFPAQTVMAAYKDITCDAAGVGSGGLFNPSDVVKIDPATDPNNPCGTVAVDDVFSTIGCNYILILNDVFSKFFCALQYGMRDAIVFAVTLFLVLYGSKIVMGTQETTGGAAIMAIIKIGIIFMFTEKGTLAISYIYRFFLSFIESTVAWVFAGIDCPTVIGCSKTVPEVFVAIDQKIKTVLIGNGNSGGVFTDNGELILFFAALAIIAMPLFLLAWSLVWTTAQVFIRSLVTFMLSITAVAFLVALSPIFMSFMLFNSTYHLFDNWLRFLVSYSLQPMIIFAVFTLWIIISSDFLTFMSEIGKVITVVKKSPDKVATLSIGDELAFCPLAYPNDTSSGINLSSLPFNITLGGPHIACCEMGPSIWPNPPACAPVSATVSAPKASTTVTASQYLLDKYPYNTATLVPPESLISDGQFIYYLGYHFIALLVIASAFFELIDMAPTIAQTLARSQAVAPLGAGFGNGGGLGSMISQVTNATRRKAAVATDTLSSSLVKMTTKR